MKKRSKNKEEMEKEIFVDKTDRADSVDVERDAMRERPMTDDEELRTGED